MDHLCPGGSSLLNPQTAYLAHKNEIDEVIHRVLDSGQYILGDEVRAFEKSFAKYIGARHCVGVASGTEALFLSMKAFGIGDGDEVITVSYTATATISAICMAGATPVLVDIKPSNFTMNPALIKKAITNQTKAIIPVHIFGNACDMAPILKHGIPIIEDCAQAHGTIYKGKRVGSIGTLGCFSFYPTKNLGCLGDGGAITTNDPELAKKLNLLRQYGWETRYNSSVHGYNSRLDELQAAILNVKLKYLDEDKLKYAEPPRSIIPVHHQPGYQKLVRISDKLTETERTVHEHSA